MEPHDIRRGIPRPLCLTKLQLNCVIAVFFLLNSVCYSSDCRRHFSSQSNCRVPGKTFKKPVKLIFTTSFFYNSYSISIILMITRRYTCQTILGQTIQPFSSKLITIILSLCYEWLVIGRRGYLSDHTGTTTIPLGG